MMKKIDPLEAHIWHKKFMPDQVDIEGALKLLNADEQKKASNFKFLHLQQRFIYTHAELRKILSLYLDCDPKEIEFSLNPQRKPSIKEPKTNLQFNLSHTENTYAIGLHGMHPLGIDIETINKEINLNIAKRFFTKREYATIIREKNKENAFYFFLDR